MRYIGMPMGMWALFKGPFYRNLVEALGFSYADAGRITRQAKGRYKEIIHTLPEFEKGDMFQMNIVSCAMFSAFLLSMDERPPLEKLTEYYRRSMMTAPTRWFCRMSGRQKYSEKDVANMRRTAALRAADRNKYSWNMEFLLYPDGSGYEARFTHCGICTLMGELGLGDAVPAMCRLDYAMARAGGATDFVRDYTLASGGPYCDCGYKKKAR